MGAQKHEDPVDPHPNPEHCKIECYSCINLDALRIETTGLMFVLAFIEIFFCRAVCRTGPMKHFSCHVSRAWFICSYFRTVLWDFLIYLASSVVLWSFDLRIYKFLSLWFLLNIHDSEFFIPEASGLKISFPTALCRGRNGSS